MNKITDIAAAHAVAARDHEAIMRRLVGQDFPWDYQRSMIDIVFAKSLAPPRIAGLVAARGYFKERTQKRYDDTALILLGFVKHGYSSERGAQALARMNEIHARFTIRQDDYMYVLTLLMIEPVRWNARFGWRRMTDAERLSNYYFWREVGARMGIAPIPASYEACEAFKADYERENLRRTEASASFNSSLFALIESWVPGPVRPLVKPVMSTLLEEKFLACFDLPKPPALLAWFVPRALEARARALRLLPKRRRPIFYEDGRLRSYPNGYEIADLGPPSDWTPPRRRRKASSTPDGAGDT